MSQEQAARFAASKTDEDRRADMSEKIMVGQWVTCGDCVGQVEEVADGSACRVKLEGRDLWGVCHPFTWKVGKTYSTTIDGVTATVLHVERDMIKGRDSRDGKDSFMWAWGSRDGRLLGVNKQDGLPHLLPYLADDPQTVAEAAKFGEFAEADECDEPDALQSLLTEFSHRREQCQRMAEDWETKAAEWRKAEQMIVQAIERANR